jgi:hypothetical protein
MGISRTEFAFQFRSRSGDKAGLREATSLIGEVKRTAYLAT